MFPTTSISDSAKGRLITQGGALEPGAFVESYNIDTPAVQAKTLAYH